MSKKAKGSKYEREVMKILENDGWVVERAHPQFIPVGPGRIISKAHDYFGAWDIIGKRPGYKTLWVQVSTLAHVSDKRAQVNGFPWTPEHDEPCIFARVEGRNRHFRVYYAREGYQWTGKTERVPK